MDVMHEQMPGALNLIDTAIRLGTFQTFTRLLEGSHFERTLRSGGSYTVFAPADISFAYIGEETIRRLLCAEGLGILAEVLSYHAVPGKIMRAELEGLKRVKTLHGAELTLCNDRELRIEGARLLYTDIEAQNGVIHGIDRVLLPTHLRESVAASA